MNVQDFFERSDRVAKKIENESDREACFRKYRSSPESVDSSLYSLIFCFLCGAELKLKKQ